MSASRHLTLAVSQSHTQPTKSQTLAALAATAARARSRGVDLLLYPEAYLGGYPRGCAFGSRIGERAQVGREQFLRYWNEAVDLGDTARGRGDGWVERWGEEGGEDGGESKNDDWNGNGNGWKDESTEKANREDHGGEREQRQLKRGDGTREELERVARETGVFLIVGAVEKAGGSLYCAVVYVCPRKGCVGKRRKVMPTATERLIWAQGSPSTLRTIKTTIKGVEITLAAAVCWENYMPLLRFSLYSQGVNLYLAPTADARDTWLPLMRTIALESRAFVLSANQCIRKKDLPDWIDQAAKSGPKASDGGGAASHAAPSVNGDDRSTDAGNGVEYALSRRKSIVTRTEHNHEISWPAKAAEEASMERPSLPRRKSSVIPAGPHELRLPAVTPAESQTAQDISEVKEDGEPENGDSNADPKMEPPSGKQGQQEQPEARGNANRISRNEVDDGESFACRGGSCIVGPDGAVLAGPLWEEPEGGLLVARVDFDDCIRGHLDFDAVGSYSRNDAFELRVRGLCLDPPL